MNRDNDTLQVLSVSDRVVNRIYDPGARTRFPKLDLVLGCGDLPYYYLEFIIDTFHAPLFYVHGNHDAAVEVSDYGRRTRPQGAINLHRRLFRYGDILFMGLEGSNRYREGNYQYTQGEMWLRVLSLVPRLLFNKVVYGRALDILISHSPPWGVHDKEDLPHHGFKAIRWLIEVFQPAYHFHGHVHIYGNDTKSDNTTMLGPTKVINTCGWKHTEISVEKMVNRFKQAGE
jgi:Icc-related predicted phosphoesterase